jgi:hypothetical protein
MVLIYVRLSRTQGHSSAERIRSIEKRFDLIGNRTRDRQACSIVPNWYISTKYWVRLTKYSALGDVMFSFFPCCIICNQKFVAFDFQIEACFKLTLWNVIFFLVNFCSANLLPLLLIFIFVNNCSVNNYGVYVEFIRHMIVSHRRHDCNCWLKTVFRS